MAKEPRCPIRLRQLAEADLPILHRWYQTPELWEHLVGDFRPRAETEALAFMRRWLEPAGDELRLAIESLGDSRLIGLAALTTIDTGEGAAELHIFFGEPADRGRGWGGAAMAALLRRAFDEIGLRHVRLRVLGSNERARRLYEAIGFETDGQETTIKAGKEVEVVAMSICDAAFQAGQADYARRSATR